MEMAKEGAITLGFLRKKGTYGIESPSTKGLAYEGVALFPEVIYPVSRPPAGVEHGFAAPQIRQHIPFPEHPESL